MLYLCALCGFARKFFTTKCKEFTTKTPPRKREHSGLKNTEQFPMNGANSRNDIEEKKIL
jgi:hypothetical protein